MDAEATTRGLRAHSIAERVERLVIGLRDIAARHGRAFAPGTLERLAGAYALKLEAADWCERRGYRLAERIPLPGRRHDPDDANDTEL